MFGKIKDRDSLAYEAFHKEKATMFTRHLGTEPKVSCTDLHKEIV